MNGEGTWAIQAVDFADDGGTLYTLFDETRRPVLAAAWPQPLEAVAAVYGFVTTRLPSVTEATPDERE